MAEHIAPDRPTLLMSDGPGDEGFVDASGSRVDAPVIDSARW